MQNIGLKYKKTVKFVSVLLCFILLLTANFTVSAGSLTAAQFQKKLDEVEKLYPQGSQQYEWKVNGSVVGWQCHGYVRWITHYVWGVDFANGNGTGWKLHYATATTTPIDKIVPGDVLRYRTSPTKESNHTIFITRVADDMVYFTDCNSDGKNTIKWERCLSKDTLAEYLKRKMSGYNTLGYIGHYEPNILTVANSVSISFNVNGGAISDSGKTITEYTVVDSKGLNLRSGAGTSFGRVGAMPKNTVFIVSETAEAGGYTWGKTVYNGITGWCVISEDWTTTETISIAPYYTDSKGNIMSSESKSKYIQTMLYGSEYKNGFITADDFDLARKGYTFSGWSKTKNGSVIENSSGSIIPEKIFPELKNGDLDVTLYAVWKSNAVLSGIEVEKLPIKTKYLLNAPFDSSGLEIKLKYSNKTSKIITTGFTLKGFSSTTAGEKNITVSYGTKTTTFKVLVEDLKTGDLNGDFSIDLSDVNLLKLYVTGWNVEIYEKALDVNGDKIVDLVDVVLLAQYVAGWDNAEIK